MDMTGQYERSARAAGRACAARIHAAAILVVLLTGGGARAHDYFKITIVDEQTKRGVPLVELRTSYEVRYVTDSNGVVAFHEPGLMDENVYFAITSHGYEFPKENK